LPIAVEIILIIIIGSSFGSFFNVCIYRLPQKKSIVYPSSYCPNCSQPIPKWLNMPIIGFFLTKGRCRECKTKIHWHYPVVEFISALLFLLLFFRFGSYFSFIYFKYALLIGFLIIIFFIDLYHKIIPDTLSLPLIIIGLITIWLPYNDVSVKSALTGAAFGFLLFFIIPYVFWKLTGKVGIGGGDIKLILGVGLFIGFIGVIFSILVSSIIALITLPLIRFDLKKEFPFGTFITIGVLLYLFIGKQIIDWYLDLILL